MSRILKLIVLLAIYTQPLVSTGQDLTRMNRGELRDLAVQLQKANDEYNSKILSLLETEALLKRNIQSLASENGYHLENITNLNNQVLDQQTQLRQYDSQLNEMRRELIRFNLIVDSLTNESVSLYSMVQSLRDSLSMVLERSVVHGEVSPCGESISDIEANIYRTLQIGDQCWMAENLRTTQYADGTPIANITDDDQWFRLDFGAWANYDNNPANDAIYGKLYNWYAATDSRNICPVGWHVPSDAEWTFLSDFLGEDAGHKMKSTIGWSENGNGSSESGFNGLPGGSRYFDGTFNNAGSNGLFWSSSEYPFDGLGFPSVDSGWAWFLYLPNYSRGLDRSYHYNGVGLSVRCLRD